MAEKYRDVCTHCRKRTMVWLINDTTRLCDKCAEDLDYIQCDVCGEFFRADFVEFTELPDGRTVCEYCAEDL